MKWFKKFISLSCLCCGEVAVKDVKEIPLGEHVLYDLIKNKDWKVSDKRYEKITLRFEYIHLASYPLCKDCYARVEVKWQENKTKEVALLEKKKKDNELKEYYAKLSLEVERRELEERAKKLGINLEGDF